MGRHLRFCSELQWGSGSIQRWKVQAKVKTIFGGVFVYTYSRKFAAYTHTQAYAFTFEIKKICISNFLSGDFWVAGVLAINFTRAFDLQVGFFTCILVCMWVARPLLALPISISFAALSLCLCVGIVCLHTFILRTAVCVCVGCGNHI